MQIQAELENISTVKKRLKIAVAAEEAQKELNEILKEYKKHARLPGFRAGKAPIEMVRRRFSKDIRKDVLEKLIPESYGQAVKEQGVSPLSAPELENLQYEEGQGLSYEALFEISPVITLPEYRGLEVSAPAVEVSDEDVEQQLEQLQDRHATLVAVEDRAIQTGDWVLVDLQGEYLEDDTKHGHAHPPIQDEGVTVQVGGDNTHEAFSEGLLGMQIAEEKTIEVDYPADYPEKKLAGHRLRFTLEVNDIKERRLPELNDEFAREAAENIETLDQLRERIREQISRHRERHREDSLRDAIVTQLIDKTGFEVPEVLIEARIDDKIRDLALNVASRGVDPLRANLDWRRIREELRASAEKEVRAVIILEEIANQEKIEVPREALDAEFEKLAESTEQPIEKVRQYFLQGDRFEELQGQLKRRQALDLLLESARIQAS